jgi:hypothetical protein
VSELIVETSDRGTEPAFSPPSGDLVSFLSFAAADRYGSQHPLSLLANRLRRQQRIDLGSLWEFYEAEPEDELDSAQLERIWQDPAPVAAAASACAAALEADADLAALAAGFPALVPLLKELAAAATSAAQRGARLRLTYRL